MGQVRNNSTLGSPVKQPRAAGLARTPPPQFLLHLSLKVSVFDGFAFSEGKAAHSMTYDLFRPSIWDRGHLLYIYNTGKSFPTESSVTY